MSCPGDASSELKQLDSVVRLRRTWICWVCLTETPTPKNTPARLTSHIVAFGSYVWACLERQRMGDGLRSFSGDASPIR